MNILQTPHLDFQFTAQWITLSHPAHPENITFEAQKTFTLAQLPAEARLRITADTTYRLTVNGRLCGYGPIRGTASLQFFDTLDLHPYLHLGDNTLSVTVHSPVRENFICAPVLPALLAELPGVLKTDSTWQVRPLLQWKSDVPGFTMQTGFMEYLDLTIPPGPWEPPVVVTEPRLLGKRLIPRNIPELDTFAVRPTDVTAMAQLPPGDAPSLEELPQFLNDELWNNLPVPQTTGFTIPNHGDNATAVVWDFNGEWIGQLRLTVDAPADTVVDLVYGEEPWKDGRLRALFPYTIYRFTDRYILKEGVNTLGTTMTERGFKMVQAVFRHASRPITVQDIHAKVIRYPFADTGAFYASDEVLNRIYTQCVETLKACTTDVFMDCPWRERAFWVNDLIVENRTSLAAFGASQVHRRAFQLAFSQQLPNGIVPALCPQPQDTNANFPATNLFLILMLQDYLLASGDQETIRQYLPNCQRILTFFQQHMDADNLIALPDDLVNFYDWGFDLDDYHFQNARESMIDSIFILATKAYLWLCDQTGLPVPDRQQRLDQLDRTSQAIQLHFFNEDTNHLEDPVFLGKQPTTLASQLSHAFAYLAQIGDDSLKRASIKALDDDSLHRPEFYLHLFVLQAMVQTNQIQVGLNRIRQHWGRMAMTGHPTVYETGIHQFGREAFREAGSLCHGFATAPISFLQTGILGVQPVEPGFRTFRFTPCLADLDNASGRIPTPTGNIAVELTSQAVILRIPQHCSAILNNQTRIQPGIHNLTWEQLA